MSDQNLLEQAIYLHRRGKLSQACQLYEKFLRIYPHHPSATHNLGMVLVGLGKLKKGVELVEQVIRSGIRFPELSTTCKEIGMTLYNQGYWHKARPWLSRAVHYFPNDQLLLLALQRLSPRSYLAPEVYDYASGETLKRYSPKESEKYVFVIDVSGTCNLACPSCPVGNMTHVARPRGFMKLELFQAIIDKISSIREIGVPEIFLFNWGEPLLHPQLPEIINSIHAKKLTCQLSTNLNIDKNLPQIIGANPDVLKISLSGFSKASYEKTHKRGNIHLVKSNLYKLRYLLDKTGATTRVWIGYHLYKSNGHEAEKVKDLCLELNFDFQPIQAFYQPVEKLIELDRTQDKGADPLLNQLLIHPLDNVQHIRTYRNKNFDCELRFNQTVINADGSVALCCAVYEPQNMLEASFLETPFTDLEEMKYRHPFCKTCRAFGADYSLADLPENLHPDQTAL